MELKYIAISKLKPYERNPRRNDDAVAALANSIMEFGFKNPIIVTGDYTIISGHTRYKAAELLGLQSVPCLISSLTNEQAMAFRLADNKTGEVAKWNELLKKELQEARQLGFNMENFGFEEIITDFDGDEFYTPTEPVENTAGNHTQEMTCPYCGEKFTP